MSDDWYGDYIKQLDGALNMAKNDATCIYTVSDASAPSKGNLQVSLASLVFWGTTKTAHIVAAGGHTTAPNVELMALELSVATALAVGCLTLVCFTDSTMAMMDLVDPSPHSSQGSSLAACSALWHWFTKDQGWTLHL